MDTPVNVVGVQPFVDQTSRQLKAKAKELGIKNYGRKSKKELVKEMSQLKGKREEFEDVGDELLPIKKQKIADKPQVKTEPPAIKDATYWRKQTSPKRPDPTPPKCDCEPNALVVWGIGAITGVALSYLLYRYLASPALNEFGESLAETYSAELDSLPLPLPTDL